MKDNWLSYNQNYLNQCISNLMSRIGEKSTNVTIFTKENDDTVKKSNLEKLVSRYQLSDFERDVVILASGLELSAEFNKQFSQVFNYQGLTYASYNMALKHLDNAHWDALVENGPLRRYKIIKTFSDELFINNRFTLDDYILQYITGFGGLSHSLLPYFKKVHANYPEIKSHMELADIIVDRASIKGISRSVIYSGNIKDSISVALRCAEKSHLDLYSMNALSITENAEFVISLAYEWNKVAKLNNFALFVDCTSIDINNPSLIKYLYHFISNLDGIFYINASEEFDFYLEGAININIQKPTRDEQDQTNISLFSKYLDHEHILRLFHRYNFSAFEIFEISQEFNAKIKSSSNDLSGILTEICSEKAKPKIGNLISKIDIKYTWNDIILPKNIMNTLSDIVNHVLYQNEVFEVNGFKNKMSRNRGISVLFTGESGTGKTMAAEVIANKLGLSLYRVDLSQVINKYIGETEKNIKKIFDAAETGGHILLFDEADAIFGKRSEVKDSHDRYSNIQIGYLLQRMEEFSGISILTTNMRSSFDKAFDRRIRFIVTFPKPDTDLRKQIWENAFPSECQLKNICYDKLAGINVSGGNIKNIALNAAFLAASNGKVITMEHLAIATRYEFSKMDKNINENELKVWKSQEI
ncbi:MAG: ATP-binding protein [Saprospiraceae bacterium]|nr:ATP-binding protein [Saprospiraceae bacterium]